MSKRRALITGITGQDGSFLAEFLINKGYEVHGIRRRSSSIDPGRLQHLFAEHINKDLYLEYGDLSDGSALRRLLFRVQPNEIYNLAAQSHVRISFEQAEYTADVTGVGPLRLLEAMRDYIEATGRDVRYYQASSSEMFGSSPPPQNEQTPFHPRSPYGVAKVSAFWSTVNAREAYGYHCSNGILFNHESERRGENFVTRKITRAAGRIKAGQKHALFLGNMEAKRDWGYAGDFVEAMWLMLQQDKPDDYVIATGEAHTVRDVLDVVFGYLGLDWNEYVRTDPYFFRPAEVDYLCGDASKARRTLGWHPKVGFEEMLRIMTEHDLELAEREIHAKTFVPSSDRPWNRPDSQWCPA